MHRYVMFGIRLEFSWREVVVTSSTNTSNSSFLRLDSFFLNRATSLLFAKHPTGGTAWVRRIWAQIASQLSRSLATSLTQRRWM